MQSLLIPSIYLRMIQIVMPNFFIVGAPKCATSSMAAYLGQHPDIYMSQEKEPHFFMSEGGTLDSFSGNTNYWWSSRILNRTDYEKLFSGVKNETAIGEASTWYLFLPKCAERIKSEIPDAKIIIFLRNPVDRAFSDFKHSLKFNLENITDFNEAVRIDDDRIRKNDIHAQYYIQLGMYYSQVKRYFDVFGRQQVRVYLYDDIMTKLDVIIKNIFTFLEVSENFNVDTHERHMVSQLPVGKLGYNRIGQILKNNLVGKKVIKTIFPPFVYKYIKNQIDQKTQITPIMTAATRTELIAIYKEDLVKLQQLIDKDLSGWITDKS